MEIIDDLMSKPNIAFGYFVKGKFVGWRADSFGTISLLRPKIYKYTESQMSIIRKNTQYELSKQGTSFFKQLFNKGFTPINTESEILEKDTVIEQINNSEQEKRNWGEFEIHAIPFPYEYNDVEEWKMEAFNKNLPDPLETLKFKTIDNEN